MAESIDGLFQSQPLMEITEISTRERDRFVKDAETYILSLTERNFDGGAISDLYRSMIRSLIELYARQEAMKRSGRFSIMDGTVYELALKNLQLLLEQNSFKIDLIQNTWLNHARETIVNLFNTSKTIFEPYILGELCENLYLDNKGAYIVLNKFINNNTLHIVDNKYKCNLLSLL